MRKATGLGFLFFALLALCGVSAVGASDGVLVERVCPHAPESTRAFFFGASPDKDRADIVRLAGEIREKGASACIVALINPMDFNYSRKLAIRRAIWVRNLLEGEGIPRSSLSYELRIISADIDFEAQPKLAIVLEL